MLWLMIVLGGGAFAVGLWAVRKMEMDVNGEGRGGFQIDGEYMYRIFERKMRREGYPGDVETVDRIVESVLTVGKRLGVDEEEFYRAVECNSGVDLRLLRGRGGDGGSGGERTIEDSFLDYMRRSNESGNGRN